MDEKSRLYDAISKVLTDYEDFVNGIGNDSEIYEMAADMYQVLIKVQNKWETEIIAQ